MGRLYKILALFSTIVLFADVARCQRKAECNILKGSGSGNVQGTIILTQQAAGTNVTLRIVLQDLNVTATKQHGFHVHANASLGNKCVEAAGHLNVLGTLHGAPTDDKQHRHTGDLGNVETDDNGVVSTTITDWLISLHDEPTSVIGKPFVIHELIDDLGRGGAATSNTTGNAGIRLGCCIIQLTESSETTGSAGVTKSSGSPGGTGTASTLSALSAWISLTLAVCLVFGQDLFSRVN